MLLCVPKIGRKLLFGKKSTLLVIIMSQEDGEKFTIPGSGESGLNFEGVPWEFLLSISTPKIFSL